MTTTGTSTVTTASASDGPPERYRVVLARGTTSSKPACPGRSPHQVGNRKRVLPTGVADQRPRSAWARRSGTCGRSAHPTPWCLLRNRERCLAVRRGAVEAVCAWTDRLVSATNESESRRTE